MSDYLTAEQLDALPEETSVIDWDNDILTKQWDGLWGSYEMAPQPSVRVAKWRPRLATPEEVAAKQAAIAAYERMRRQRHTWECGKRKRIGDPVLDRCECPIDGEEPKS